MRSRSRLSTGIEDLDRILGGGLIPGKKVVVYGATGVGKSILGVTLVHAGIKSEGHPGMLIDISTGVDEQSQLQYASDMMGWSMGDWEKVRKSTAPEALSDFAFRRMKLEDYHIGKEGLVYDDFLRHHLPQTQRLIIDGSEPYETAKGAQVITDLRRVWGEHAGFTHTVIYRNPFYLTPKKLSPIDNETYWAWAVSEKQIASYMRTEKGKFKFGWHNAHGTKEERNMAKKLRDESNWEDEDSYYYPAFGDSFKIDFLQPKGKLPINKRYQSVSTADDVIVFLQTTQERSVFDLVNRPIEVGSLDAEVNTVLVMGYFPVTAENPQQRRGLAVVKHRGSQYDGSIAEYQITDQGMVFGE